MPEQMTFADAALHLNARACRATMQGVVKNDQRLRA
jgi:hypothetical protein